MKIFSPYRKINVGKRRNMTDKHEQNPTSAVNFVEKIPCPFDEVNIEPNLVHEVVINKPYLKLDNNPN